MQRYSLLIFLSLVSIFGVAQTSYPIVEGQDVLMYEFNLIVQDTTDDITGKTLIKVKAKNVDSLRFDLVSKTGTGGMEISKVLVNNLQTAYVHKNNRLVIPVIDDSSKAKLVDVAIYYSGVPLGGLIITNNKFGDRVFFGDNYPDRARNWLPCVDHPSDKAQVQWRVTAPAHYKVVANGSLVNEIMGDSRMKTTTWFEATPISTKVMVFGAADFATEESGKVNSIPVTTWVYRENAADGFIDFKRAPKILAFYDSLIGTYPFRKLANVQSKTTYGGMENASNIFYFENSVNGKAEREPLMAHEIAHQWFGNSVTEADWPHAWISEGFATYLTKVYLASINGEEEMLNTLKKDRITIIKYWHTSPLPVVDYKLVSYPKIENLRELLSTNTYKKGSWLLHMLRNEIGDQKFWETVRAFYTTFGDSVATTADFQHIAEEVSGAQLNDFFKQWYYTDGHPQLHGEWSYDNGRVTINLTQKQENLFSFPLEIGLVYIDRMEIHYVNAHNRNEVFELKGESPNQVIIDPNVKLLFEGTTRLTHVNQ